MPKVLPLNSFTASRKAVPPPPPGGRRNTDDAATADDDDDVTGTFFLAEKFVFTGLAIFLNNKNSEEEYAMPVYPKEALVSFFPYKIY